MSTLSKNCCQCTISILDIFKKSTLTVLVHIQGSPPNFPLSTNQTLFDFFLKGGEKRIKKKTLISRMPFSAERSTWYAVSLTIAVAVVAVNLLSIILFIKNSNLRTRAMYLVINLTVVDMFVGGGATFAIVLLFLLYGCEAGNIFLIWPEWPRIFFVLSTAEVWLPLTSVAGIAVISLDRMHATFRPFRHRNIKKMGIRGNSCGRLDFNFDDSNSLSVNTSLLELESTVAIVISCALMAVILFPLPFCYLCFLHLHCFKILVWNPSSVPWCSQ